uniref:Alpha-(1,6)-fucosyltransferase N- and catalytic domain-containing protein n=2 Tax=Guillardia theta TaxID=55529 RepID=A0A7S4PJ41_GUITH|mmetsp:Transcript_52304/g.162361  ORF Transcript_52304/g.162361 Transcript_52304/m.162361 type:complete len:612 (+) Transcript_52304:40-1875(+)
MIRSLALLRLPRTLLLLLLVVRVPGLKAPEDVNAKDTSETLEDWRAGEHVSAAIRHYGSRIRSSNASANDFHHLVSALRFAGRIEESANILKAGMETVPGFATLQNLLLLGSLLRLQDRQDEACEAFQHAILSHPREGKLYLQLAMTMGSSLLSHSSFPPPFSLSRHSLLSVARLCQTATRLSEWTEETRMQSLMLSVALLRTLHDSRAPPLLRRILRMDATAWHRYEQHVMATGEEDDARDEGRGEEELRAQRLLDSTWNDLQHPRDCSKKRKVLFKLEGNIFGLGAQLHLLTLVASYAWRSGRVLVTARNDSWWYAEEGCQRKSFECYFLPITNCSMSLRAERGNFPLLGEHEEEDEIVLATIKSESWLKQQQLHTFVPPSFRSLGLLWWRSQVLWRVSRLQPWVAQELMERRRRLTSRPSPHEEEELTLGVHVRHGDKVWEEAPHVSLASYLEAIRERLKQLRRGRRRGEGSWQGRREVVFLSTDSTKVVQEMRRMAPELDLRVFSEKRNQGVAFSLLVHTHAINVTRYALDALANLHTLADSTALVATFSSNFGRAALELQLSRYFEALRVCEEKEGGHEPDEVVRCAGPHRKSPPLSLDFTWYADP